MEDDLTSIEFCSEEFVSDVYESAHAQTFFEVNPKNCEWDYTIISCFINHLTQMVPDQSRGFATKIKNKPFSTRFLFRHPFIKNCSFNIQLGVRMAVQVSRAFLTVFFTKNQYIKLTRDGLWKRELEVAQWRKMIYYSFKISNPSDGTVHLYYHKPMIFLRTFDFSIIFDYFCKRIQKAGLPINSETFSIREYISINYPTKNDADINSLDKLKEYLKGYLYLTIQKSSRKKRLAKVIRKNEEFYVIGGIFIFPYSQSILKQNASKINGLLVDTTWKVMPYYVTSILMASSSNTGLPLAFSFGNGETKELYNYHFKAFKNFFDINLEDFVFESDQGPALKGIYKDKNITHCFCLHHVLANMKYSSFSYGIGNILKSSTEFELNNALNFYSKLFSKIDRNDIALRNKLLKKVGLVFEDKQISIKDEVKFSKFSLYKRIKLKMPSTTNSLESTHGQLNAKTPRRKNFWASIYEIAKNLDEKNCTIDKHIQHNYYFEKKQTIKHYNSIVYNRIDNEIENYSTDKDHCLCSENKLLSSLLNIDIPCCHRIHLGAEFPETPTSEILLINDTNSLIDKYDPLEPEIFNGDNSIEAQDKQYAIEIIQHFGREKKREKVSEFVENNYQLKQNEIFINCKPSSILELIHLGITHFKNNE